MARFLNRTDAGQALARELTDRSFPDPIVLALPRGGVPVGIEIARALRAPMDLIMVRKIGVPTQPELAAAAVVNGDKPQIVVNEDIARHAGLSRDEIDELAQAQLKEIRRRREKYLGGRLPIPIKGKTAIVVDDGIATGATMRASLKAARQRNPAKLVMAVPVAAPETLEELRGDVDEAICLLAPPLLYAVGVHYADFGQTSDEEVVRLMEEANKLVAPESGSQNQL